MATRQHLINLHGTVAPTAEGLKDKEFKNGELAVQHGADAASSALHILTSGQTELVTFLPKGQDASYLKDADLNQIRKDITDNATVAARGITENEKAIVINTKAIGANENAIAGLDSRMDTAESEIDALQGKTMVNSFGGKTGEITLDTDASAAKSVKFIMSNNELQGTVMGLGDIVTHQHSEYATSSQGTKADTALQSVAHNNEFTGSGKSGDSLTLATKGIALEKLSQTVQDSLGKANSALQSISASGDTYVSASASGNKVSVSATTALTTAVNNANSALQEHQNAVKTITLGGNLSGNTTASAAGASVTLNATIKEGQVTNEMLAGSIASSKLNDIPSTKITHGNSTVSKEIADIKDAIKGGTHFKGVLTVKPAVDDYHNGDIIAISGGSSKDEGKEFILSATVSPEGAEDNKSWVELGDTSAEATRITALENGTKKAGDAAKLNGETKTEIISGLATTAYVNQEIGKKADSGHTHALDSDKITGILPVAKGGTGVNSLKSLGLNSFNNDANFITSGATVSKANQLTNSATLKIEGGSTEDTNKYTFNGSAAKTLDVVAGNNVTLKAEAGKLTISAKDTANTDTVTTFTASGDNYITLTHTGTTFTDQKVTASADVCTNIASVSSSNVQLADAMAVKNYVDEHDAEVVNTNTPLVWGTSTKVSTVDGKAINITMPAKPEEKDTPTSIVISGTNKGGESGQTVTVSGDSFTKTINFANMIIDCGEY